MKLTINKNEFHGKLENVSKVISDNKIRPIISMCRLVCINDKLQLQGTDLEQTILTELEANIDTIGSTCINPRDVLEYLKLEDMTVIDIETKEGVVKIGNMEFAKANPDEFPDIKMHEGEIKELDRLELIRKIKLNRICAGQTGGNIAIEVVKFGKDKISSTDSYRMITDSYETGLEVSIPIQAINNIASVLESITEANISVSQAQSNLQIQAGEYFYMTRLVDLAFPDVAGLINSFNMTKKASINLLQLEKSLKKVYISASRNQEGKNTATFTFAPGKLEIRAVSSGTRAKEKLSIEYGGEEMKVSLNVKYLLDFIKNINKNVIMEFSDSQSAFKLTEEGNAEYQFITMPVAIREE